MEFPNLSSYHRLLVCSAHVGVVQRKFRRTPCCCAVQVHRIADYYRLVHTVSTDDEGPFFVGFDALNPACAVSHGALCHYRPQGGAPQQNGRNKSVMLMLLFCKKWCAQ